MKSKKFRMNSIRVKLISSLIAICIIPLTIAAVFSYYQSTSILNNKLEETSGQTLSEINNGLTNYFTALSSQASMMSTQYNFINVEEDQGKNIASLQDILNSVKGSNQAFASVYYGTETDKFIESPKVDNRVGFIPKERPWYKLAISNEDNLVITDPYSDSLSGERMITVAKTVKKDGKVIGVVGMDIVLTNLADTINKSKVGDNGYVYIVDSKGLLLTHPDKSIIGTDIITELSFWNETKINDKGFAKYIYKGEKKFGAYEKNELTGWKLGAVLEESELLKNTNSIRNTQIGISIIFFVVAIIMSLILSNSIVVNMRNLKEAFKKASKGDLTATVNVKTQDDFKDVGQDFDSMMKNISGLMVEVKESSITVLDTATTLSSMAIGTRTSVGEVSRAIEEVAAGATSQAQNAQDGTSEMNDLSNRIDGISNNSIEMDKISTDTHKLTSKGLGMVKTLIEKSDKTKDSTMQVNKIVQDMNKSTVEINAISEKISQITEQTNLLALNASIEAARAGDAGRGFSVVAEEIRKLAEQSKNSTEEIKKIIENIQSKSLTAVRAIEETENIVEEQDFAVKETQDIFTEILKSISVMIETVTDIKKSVVEVNNKKMSVVAQIENISAISQETAASSEEVTASAEEINSTMEEVAELSEQLKTLSEELEQKVSMFTVS